jgi:hypothetical protein
MSDEQLGLARDRALREHVLACRCRKGQRATGVWRGWGGWEERG